MSDTIEASGETNASVLVLGLGNVLLGDDGVGAAAIAASSATIAFQPVRTLQQQQAGGDQEQ